MIIEYVNTLPELVDHHRGRMLCIAAEGNDAHNAQTHSVLLFSLQKLHAGNI
uniref:Kinesin motor domain-containing protein n=1 Tax=Ascaris lumbricoides TaxID=6252 RepID=A0A9J2PZS0_ASCLU